MCIRDRSKKLLRGARFQISGEANVRIGAVQEVNGNPRFSPPIKIQGPSEDGFNVKVDYITSGVGFVIRVESVEDSSWELHGYELDIEKLSTY